MSKAKDFSFVLARTRKDRGFPSAYKFFKAVGGSKSLGMSFVSYWDIERGKKLPRSARLNGIIEALGLKMASVEGKDLIKAYFTSLSGSDEMVRAISAPDGAEAADPAQARARRAISMLSVALTLEQARVMVRDRETCFCFNCLSETEGWLTVKELCEGFGFKTPAVKKALKALSACGLVELSGDKARGRNAGKIVHLMPMSEDTLPLRLALRGHYNDFVTRTKPLAGRRCIVRMTKSALDQYADHLRKTIELAETYGDPRESRENSDIYLIEGRVARFFPKK